MNAVPKPMNADVREPHDGDTGTQARPQAREGATTELFAAIQFLARFLGGPVPGVAVHEALHNLPRAAGNALPELAAFQALLQAAGLSATPLPDSRSRRPTEMPALLLGADGSCLVALSIRDDGFLELHEPGIDGVLWLDPASLAARLPQLRWLAVRPTLHLDQRSLLYTLPRSGRWFWDTFSRNRWVFGWALIGTVALNLFGALIPFYSMAVYDRVIPHNALNSLGVLTTAVVLLTAFDLVMRNLRSHLLEAAARRMDVALSAQVFAQCLRMRAANRPASGGVLANTVRDFESVREFFSTGTLTVLGDLPFMALYLLVIFLVGGWLAAVPMVFIPLLLGVSLLARKPLARQANEGMQESTQRTAHLFETMNGLDTVKSLGAEAWSRRKWEALTQAIAANTLKTRELTATMGYINNALLGLATVSVVAVGALLMSEHQLTVGQIIAVSMLCGRALAPAAQVAGLVLRWEQTKLSFTALNKVMGSPVDETEAALQAPPLTGQIEFREITFAYPQQPPILDKLSLRIRPGDRVGIIGKLGSGKSTLLKLIINLYQPDSGSLLVDGMVSTHLDPLSLRRQIGYVPQDLTLFHGSVRENIELGRSRAGDEELVTAMRNACLDEVVAQLPQGVASPVGERGERLSGGQRQLVAIARALLTRPRLLLLDEPSSMVDPATEQKLIAKLRALPDTTLVLVTHRMAMLALVDRLIVMDRGRVIADGPRDEVLRALATPAAGVAA